MSFMASNPLRVVQRNFLANVNKVHWYPVLPMVRKQAKYNEPLYRTNRADSSDGEQVEA